MNPLTTSNVFLRYFDTNEGKELNEVFIPISDLDYSGSPLSEMEEKEGEEKDSDCFLYRRENGEYKKILG